MSSTRRGHPGAADRLRWTRVEDELPLPGMEQRVVHPEFAGMEFLHVRARSLLNEVAESGPLPFRWTINVYRGCSHACTYCFARPSHEWLDLDADRDFERVIVVKVNAVERLRAELRSPRWTGQHVALGTNTDPYQRCEGRYRLTRGVVAALSEAGNPFSVLTKGTLVTRDLDVLGPAAERGVCTGVSLSIATLDEAVWRATEPGTPHPRARLETVAALREAGIPAGVMIAPIIPGMSDDPAQLRRLIAAAIDAGAQSLVPITLHLRDGVRQVFLSRLSGSHPELVSRMEQLYTGAYAPTRERRRISGLVRQLVRYCGGSEDLVPAGTRRDPEGDDSSQARDGSSAPGPGGGPGDRRHRSDPGTGTQEGSPPPAEQLAML